MHDTTLSALIATTLHPEIGCALEKLADVTDPHEAAVTFERIQRRILDLEADGQSLCQRADRSQWIACIQELRERYRPHLPRLASFSRIDPPLASDGKASSAGVG